MTTSVKALFLFPKHMTTGPTIRILITLWPAWFAKLYVRIFLTLMSTEEIIFKHPPATEVQIVAGFTNNFEVADHRSRFHKLVRAEFPNIIIPEQNKAAYDFGDYVLQTQDAANRIEVGMNYFRLTSIRYPGFEKYREMFLSSFNTFSDCYQIKTFYLISMSFRNLLPLPAGLKYKDCIALNVSLLDDSEPELFAGQGLLVFKKPQGFLTVQLEPKIENAVVQSYLMHLMFATNRELSDQFDKELVPQLTDIAHGYLKKFFLSLLTKQYLDYLRTL
jgi:uncharacterized protein (TIGR04255 family)